MVHDGVTNTYKIVDRAKLVETNKEVKTVANKLGIADRMAIIREDACFGTLKGHKINFKNNPTIRLINPSKCDIGRVSKPLLDEFNNNTRKATGVKQWKGADEVLEWLKGIKQIDKYKFIK